MPGQGGASSNVMQMMMGMMQLKQQEKEATQRAESENVRNQQAGWTLLTNVARRTTDPMRLTELAKQGEKWGLGKTSEILDTLTLVQPDEETVRSFGAVQGVKKATGVPMATLSSSPESDALFGAAAARVLGGSDRGSIAQSDYVANVAQTTPDLGTAARTAAGNVMRTRWMTGGGQADVAKDEALGKIPESVWQKGFAMEHGFEMTAPQKSASDLGWAGLRSDDAYKTGSLVNDATRAAAAGAKGGLEPHHLPDLFGTQQRLLSDMQTQLSALSPTDKLARLRTLRGINKTIRDAGGYAPDFDENDALKNMHDPSAWEGFKKMITSKPPMRP